jgi:hypothetical protein
MHNRTRERRSPPNDPVEHRLLGPDGPSGSAPLRPYVGLYGPSLILPPAPVAAAELELERELFGDPDGEA